jgi:hypothetical protein
MRVIRTAIGPTTINQKLLTCAERAAVEARLRRKQTNATIMALIRDAVPFKEIVRRTGRTHIFRRCSRFLTLDLVWHRSQRLEQQTRRNR